jgi:hypothetical protein
LYAALPWTLITVFVGYKLGRRAKANDDTTTLVVDDVKLFLAKIEELCPLIAAHQAGTPSKGTSLEKSREHLTTLRKAAVAVHKRIQESLKSGNEQERWQGAYFKWRHSTDDDTGWITNKAKKWSRDSIKDLEKASDDYTQIISNLRNGIAQRRVKLKK